MKGETPLRLPTRPYATNNTTQRFSCQDDFSNFPHRMSQVRWLTKTACPLREAMRYIFFIAPLLHALYIRLHL